jgi:hypothetical protein
MLYDVRKQEREALAAIVDYAERMKNLKSQDDINRSVMDSLHQAVGALQRVVVILRQSQQFWRNMGVGFDNIAKSGLSDKIDAYRQIAGTDAERATLYLDPDFTREMIEYLAGWQALHLIAVDYADASQEVKDGIAVDYQKNLTPEEAAKAVPELAQMLIDLTTPAYEAAKTEEATVAKAVAPA